MSTATMPTGSLTAPRRNTRTYQRDGREVYADTGRPVDERLGTHVVLWIVDDADAWAAAIEAEGDAQVSEWPKSRRYIGEHRRAQAYESAAQVRAQGAGRTVRDHHHSLPPAEAEVAGLYRAHPNPGVRYEVAPITEVGACLDCQQPTIHVDGVWRHHSGRYPVDCHRDPEPEPEEPLAAGEFEINVGRGSMTCGYCGDTEAWSTSVLGYTTLTGFHLLGIHRESNTLVVLAEATTLTGQTTHLPHHCAAIPEDVHRKYAPTTVLHREPADEEPAAIDGGAA